MTSLDKSNSCVEDIQNTKLRAILEAELTTKDQSLNGFWNNYSQEISEKLLLHHMTDSPGWDKDFSHSYFKDSVRNLQKSVSELSQNQKNSSTISWKLSQSTQPDIMDQENIIARRLRFYPNHAQRELLDKCFKVHKYFYNKALTYAKSVEFKKISLINIRTNILVRDKDMDEHDPEVWTQEIPYDCRQLAIKCFVNAFKAANALKKLKHIKSFDMKPLDDNSTNIVYCDASALNTEYELFVKRLGKNSQLRFRGRMRKYISNLQNTKDFSIIRDNANRYYLCLSSIKNKEDSKPNDDAIVSIDPGVRTFATTYSQNECIKYGNGFASKLDKIYSKCSDLSELCTNTNHSKRYNITRRCKKIRAKIKNKVSDFQWKLARELLNKHDVILLPSFNVQGMVKNNPNSNMNRQMLLLSHYKFKQKLLYKAKTIAGKTVIICNESWTSKTCSNCGNINMELGSSEVYNCGKCNRSIDRDVNGSRNIFIRSLTKYYDSYPGKTNPVRKLVK